MNKCQVGHCVMTNYATPVTELQKVGCYSGGFESGYTGHGKYPGK